MNACVEATTMEVLSMNDVPKGADCSSIKPMEEFTPPIRRISSITIKRQTCRDQ